MISENEELKAEIKALRARLSRLSEANLRINEDLDFDHVLREVLESARTLTEARYGVITVLGESGQVEVFLPFLYQYCVSFPLNGGTGAIRAIRDPIQDA